MTGWQTDIGVIIPAYKAASLLRELLPRVLAVVPAQCIIVVDDASNDETPEVCAHYGILRLHHAINRGKGAALATGFGHCMTTDIRWAITMDADGQHSPDDLHKFVAASHGTPAPGICIGARSMVPGVMPPERILSNRLTSAILSLFCGIPVKDSQCGYRLYSMEFIRRIEIVHTRFEMESEVIMKAAFLGFPVTFTGIQTLYLKGPSHISHLIDTIRWVGAVISIRRRKKAIITTASLLRR
jgi:glycosyltransferase involved in cell wall biosynthesis